MVFYRALAISWGVVKGHHTPVDKGHHTEEDHPGDDFLTGIDAYLNGILLTPTSPRQKAPTPLHHRTQKHTSYT